MAQLDQSKVTCTASCLSSRQCFVVRRDLHNVLDLHVMPTQATRDHVSRKQLTNGGGGGKKCVGEHAKAYHTL